MAVANAIMDFMWKRMAIPVKNALKTVLLAHRAVVQNVQIVILEANARLKCASQNDATRTTVNVFLMRHANARMVGAALIAVSKNYNRNAQRLVKMASAMMASAIALLDGVAMTVPSCSNVKWSFRSLCQLLALIPNSALRIVCLQTT